MENEIRNKLVVFRFKNKYIVSMNKVGTAFFKELCDEVFSIEFSNGGMFDNLSHYDNTNKSLNKLQIVGKLHNWQIIQTSHSNTPYETTITYDIFKNIKYVIMRDPRERLISGINYLIIKYFGFIGITEDEILSYSDDVFNDLIINKFLKELQTPKDWNISEHILENPHIKPYIHDLKIFLNDVSSPVEDFLDINRFSNFWKDNKYFLKIYNPIEMEDFYPRFRGFYHSKSDVKSKIKKETFDLIIEKIIPTDYLTADLKTYFQKIL